MAIDPNLPCTEEGRQSQSWVECPPGSKQPARRVKPCNTVNDPLFVKDVEDAVSAPALQIINYNTADTELEITIPKEVKRFVLKAGKGVRWQFSYVLGESNTDFWDVPYGGVYEERALCLGVDLKLYVRADKAKDFKLRYWT